VDAIADLLREEIVSGDIAPGERIRSAELAQRFEVSHVPIREALRRLESEGLVVIRAQRRVDVAEVQRDDCVQLYGLRRLIECDLLRQSVPRLRPADLEAAHASLAVLGSGLEDPSAPGFFGAHAAFHGALLAPVMTGWAKRIVATLRLASERYVRLYARDFGAIEASMNDHRALLVAAEAKDGNLAAKLLANHLTRTESEVLKGLHLA